MCQTETFVEPMHALYSTLGWSPQLYSSEATGAACDDG